MMQVIESLLVHKPEALHYPPGAVVGMTDLLLAATKRQESTTHHLIV